MAIDRFKSTGPFELMKKCMDFYPGCTFEMGGRTSWWAIIRDSSNQRALVSVQSGKTPLEVPTKLYKTLEKQII